MNDDSIKQKLNPESVFPEADQALKKHHGDSPENTAADAFVRSLPGENCPPALS